MLIMLVIMVIILTVEGMYLTPDCHRKSDLLTCQCGDGDTDIYYLSLDINTVIKQHGNKVQSVLVENCHDVMVYLDLRNVNPSNIPFVKFEKCGKVEVKKIDFDPQLSEEEILDIRLEDIAHFIMKNMFVDEAFQITATGVQHLELSNSTFSHIPLPGLVLEQTDKLSIINCVFLRISPGSINVDHIKDVVIVNNQFNIDIVDIVETNKSSNLYISCNRLLDDPVSRECITTAHPPQSVTEGIKSNNHHAVVLSEKHISEAAVTKELLAGIIVGVLLLLMIFVGLCFCFTLRKRKEEKKKRISLRETNEVEQAIILTQDIKDEDPIIFEIDENKSLLTPIVESSEEVAESKDEDEEEAGKQLKTPVWLSEIHSNKIFNKQKLINVEGSEDIGKPQQVRIISDILESSDDNLMIVDEDIEQTNVGQPPMQALTESDL